MHKLSKYGFFYFIEIYQISVLTQKLKSEVLFTIIILFVSVFYSGLNSSIFGQPSKSHQHWKRHTFECTVWISMFRFVFLTDLRACWMKIDTVLSVINGFMFSGPTWNEHVLHLVYLTTRITTAKTLFISRKKKIAPDEIKHVSSLGHTFGQSFVYRRSTYRSQWPTSGKWHIVIRRFIHISKLVSIMPYNTGDHGLLL